MRFRTTAGPTFRVTVMPRRTVVPGVGATNTKKWRVWCLWPPFWTRKNSLRFRNRKFAGNPSGRMRRFSGPAHLPPS